MKNNNNHPHTYPYTVYPNALNWKERLQKLNLRSSNAFAGIIRSGCAHIKHIIIVHEVKFTFSERDEQV